MTEHLSIEKAKLAEAERERDVALRALRLACERMASVKEELCSWICCRACPCGTIGDCMLEGIESEDWLKQAREEGKG